MFESYQSIAKNNGFSAKTLRSFGRTINLPVIVAVPSGVTSLDRGIQARNKTRSVVSLEDKRLLLRAVHLAKAL